MRKLKAKTRKKGSGGARPRTGPRKPNGEAKKQAGIRIYPSDLALVEKKHGSLQKGMDYFVAQIKQTCTGMTNKLPRFLTLHNPMVGDAVYIYHSRKPRFLAEKTPEGFAVVDQIDEGETAGVLNRMHDWYIAYTVNRKQQR